MGDAKIEEGRCFPSRFDQLKKLVERKSEGVGSYIHDQDICHRFGERTSEPDGWRS